MNRLQTPRGAFLAAAIILALPRCASDTGTGPASVVTVVLSPPSATLPVGAMMQFTASVKVDGAPAAAEPVTFASDNPAVASISPQGALRALSVGATSITARTSSGASATGVVTVIVGLPVSLAKSGGDDQTAASGSAVAVSPSVTVRDAAGNLLPGVSVTFALASGGGSITGATPTTNAAGLATLGSWTLGDAGANTVTATVRGLPPVIFTATATQPSITLANSSVTFAGSIGAPDPPDQVVAISNGGTGALTGLALGAITYVGTPGWLTATLSGSVVPASVTLGVKVSGLAAGSYSATAPVTAPGAGNSPRVIAVTLKVIVPPARMLAVSQQPGGSVSGALLVVQPVIRLADASGVTVPSFTGQVRAALASGTGTLSGTTSMSAVSGVATFTDVRVTGAGQVSLSFSSDADIAPVNSEPFAVSAITPQTARMEMVTQPLGGVSGSLLGRQPEVRRVDANGNVVLTPVTVNDVVRVTLNGAGGTLTGAPGVAFPSATGVFAFTDLGVTGAGTYTLTFTSGSLTAVTSAPITIAASSATRLVVSRQPVGATSGALLATQPVVNVSDAGGGTAAGATNAVTATISSGSGTLSGTTTVAAQNGIATFSSLRIIGTGPHTLTFTSPGLAAVASASFSVAAAPATQLVVTTQPGGAVSGSVFTIQPVVQLRDANGGVATAATNAVTATINGAGGTLSGTTTVNAVSGVATFSALAVTGGGTYTLTFSAAGLVPATSATLVVAPATQGTIVFKVGASATASGVIGTNLPIPFIADMSGAQGLRLASLSFGLTWDPTKFDFVSTTNGTFGTGPSFFVNTANQAGGSITISVFDTDGFSTGTPTIYTVTLKPKASVAATIITAGITAAGDVNGNTIPNGAFTVRPLSVSTP